MKRIELSTGEELALDIIDKKSDDGRRLARVPLEVSDFLLARDETWFRGLRAGALSEDLASHSMHVLPGENRGAGRLAGYAIEVFNGRSSYRRHFTTQSLAPVANRKVVEMIKEKSATLADDFGFFLTTVRSEANGNGQSEIEPLKATVRSEPLVFEEAVLSDYLAASEPMPSVAEPPLEPDEPQMHIFASGDVWEEGRGLARRGDKKESAAVWTGRILRDKKSRDLFMVLDACIEAEHAVEETYAVTFTGETWARVRELLERRKRRLNRPHEIIVGSVHGHNFMPEADDQGRRTCEACTVAKYCSRTTATASTDDFQWHRSVFAGQPWAILSLWGSNAREQDEWRLYGLEDAALASRGIRLLKDQNL